MCRKFTSGENLTSSVVADLGKYIAIKNVPRVGPEIALTDIGIDSLRGPVEDTPDEWNKLRNGIYNDNRGVFLTHVISPSDKLNQEFDIFIYLMRHQSDDLSDIRFAEFFLGKYWNNRIFPAVLQNGFIGITTAAFGTFLCLCKITFNDGEERLISRYIDFESHRQGS